MNKVKFEFVHQFELKFEQIWTNKWTESIVLKDKITQQTALQVQTSKG